jgi:hypothetical protein
MSGGSTKGSKAPQAGGGSGDERSMIGFVQSVLFIKECIGKAIGGADSEKQAGHEEEESLKTRAPRKERPSRTLPR